MALRTACLFLSVSYNLVRGIAPFYFVKQPFFLNFIAAIWHSLFARDCWHIFLLICFVIEINHPIIYES
jgi:hypothetical protein